MKNKILVIFFVGILVVCFFPVFSSADDNQAFKISTSYNDLLSNPEHQGLLDKLMKELFLRLGIKMEIVYTSTEKALVDVNAGLLDAELNRVQGMESAFPNLIRVPEPNMTMHFVAFSNRDIKIDRWSSLKPYHIGMVSGWKIFEKNTEGFPSIIKTPTEKELFTMLHKNRLDIALYAKITGYAALKRMNYNEISHLEPPLASKPMYLYVHKKNKRLVPVIANELKKMKQDGSYETVMKGNGSL